MKMTTHRGNCGTIGPQGIRGERGSVGPMGPTGPRGPEGLTRALYENSIIVRGVDDTLKGIKFSLDNIPPSTVVQHKVPGASTELVGTATQQKLINKDLTDSSNTCRATHLASGTDGSVSLPDSLPQAGQVLLSQADQKTTWEYPNRLLQVSTFAFSVYKDILQTTAQIDITQFDQVKLNQPAGTFDPSTGVFNILQNGLFTVNFTANASTDENASTFYIDLMKSTTSLDVLLS